MKRKIRPWSQTKADQARAKAADLDRQARELERAASSAGWRQRAKIREVASRLRVQAGAYLIAAQRPEDVSDA